MLHPNSRKHNGPHTSSIKHSLPEEVLVHHHAPARSALSPTAMSSSSSRARSTKRQRTFGAPTEDDDPAAQISQARYQNAVSTRTVGGPLPTLTTCCARAFVRHVEQLSTDHHAWEVVLGWLKLIPEPLVPKLFAMLKAAHPTLLRSEFIVCVSSRPKFPRGRLLSLSLVEFHAWSVPLIDQRPTWRRVPHDPKHLSCGPFLGRTPPQRLLQYLRRDILLHYCTFAIIGAPGPFVRWNGVLRLCELTKQPTSECSRVGALTAEVIKTHCPNLLSLDLSHTSVTPVSLAGVLQNCRRLETFKVAGIRNWVRAQALSLELIIDSSP